MVRNKVKGTPYIPHLEGRGFTALTDKYACGNACAVVPANIKAASVYRAFIIANLE
jgi:hypothetical protein